MPEGDPVRKRARSETSVSTSETNGLKTTGFPRAMRLAAGEIEVARVADDERVEVGTGTPEQPELGTREPGRVGSAPRRHLCSRPAHTSTCRSRDVGARTAQARDHLGVTRIVALVGAEVEDAQRIRDESTSSTRASRCSRASARSSWWLVIISLISPREKNCMPTTTSRTPSVSSGRSDRVAGDLHHRQVDEHDRDRAR